MSNRDTTGEAFLAVIALLGLIAGMATGKISSWGDFGMAAAALGLVIVFYFGVLLARFIYLSMASDSAFWWEKYRGQYNDYEPKPSRKS